MEKVSKLFNPNIQKREELKNLFYNFQQTFLMQ